MGKFSFNSVFGQMSTMVTFGQILVLLIVLSFMGLFLIKFKLLETFYLGLQNGVYSLKLLGS